MEKISFNTALMSLPLVADKALLSRCDCAENRQPWDMDERELLLLPEGYQPGLFFIRQAGEDSAKFVVRFFRADTHQQVAAIGSGRLNSVGVFRRAGATEDDPGWDIVTMPTTGSVAVTSAGISPGVYYITVAGLISEPFRVIARETDGLPAENTVQFTTGHTDNLAEVPYKTGYEQVFTLAGSLCAGEPRQVRELGDKSERFGEQVVYSRQFRVWTLDYPSVTIQQAELLKSLELHESVTLTTARHVLRVKGSAIAVTVSDQSCCTQSVKLKIEETISEWASCDFSPALLLPQTDLTGADDAYSDPSEADTTPTPYAPGSSPAGTAPVPANPPAGAILSETRESKLCSDPFIAHGIPYKTKIIIGKANGQGDVLDEITYADPCEATGQVLPVPKLKGLLSPVFLRVGQAVNQLVLDPNLFGPSAPGDAQPVITITSLPPGVTSTGSGRLAGAPTETGETTAIARVVQPGGGSIEVPFTIVTAPQTPDVLDVDITVAVAYDSSARLITVLTTAPFQPEVKLSDPQTPKTASGFVLAESIATDSFQSDFADYGPGSYRVQVRRAGSGGMGVSYIASANPTGGATAAELIINTPAVGQANILNLLLTAANDQTGELFTDLLDDIGYNKSPTYDDVLANGNQSDHPYIHGPGGERNPFFVNTIQAIQTGYYSPEANAWFETWVTKATLLAELAGSSTLDSILAAGNTSNGIAVLGGFGLFERVRAPFARKYPVLVDATIAGRPGYFMEYQEPGDVLTALFENLTTDQKAFIRAAISAEPDLIGTVTGIRCLETDAPGTATPSLTLALTGLADGAVVTHSLSGSLFNRVLYSESGRIELNADLVPLDPPEPFKLQFSNPGAEEPFTGEAVLTPKLLQP